MATEVAALGLSVTAQGIPEATAGLKGLAEAAQQAESAADSLAAKSKRASKEAKDMAGASGAVSKAAMDMSDASKGAAGSVNDLTSSEVGAAKGAKDAASSVAGAATAMKDVGAAANTASTSMKSVDAAAAGMSNAVQSAGSAASTSAKIVKSLSDIVGASSGGMKTAQGAAFSLTQQHGALTKSAQSLSGATSAVAASFAAPVTQMNKMLMTEKQLTAEASRVVSGFKAQQAAATSLGREIADTAREAMLARTMLGSMGAAANPMKNLGLVMGQLSFQAQDFFVQIASGQSAFMAFAQQAPQAAGAFSMLGGRIGTVIPYVGTFIAVAAALAPMLLNSAKGAKTLDDAIDDLADSVSDYVDASKTVNMTTDEMIEKYGALADVAREANIAIAGIKLADAASAATSAVDKAVNDLAGLIEKTRKPILRETDYAFALAATKRLSDEYELTGANVQIVSDKIEALQNADGVAAQAVAARNLAVTLEQVYGTYDKMPAAIQEMYSGLNQIIEKNSELAAASSGWAQATLKSVGDLVTKYGEVEASNQRQIALQQAIMMYGADSAQAEAIKRQEAEAAAQALAKQEGYSGGVADNFVASQMAIYDATNATQRWADTMASVRAEVAAIAAGLSSMGGGLVSAASKFAEAKALNAGASIQDAARQTAQRELDVKFDALEASATNWVDKLLVKGNRAAEQAGLNADKALDAAREAARLRDKPAAKRSGGRSGSSSGDRAAAREADKVIRDAQAEAQRYFDGTRTSAEQYAIEIGKLNELLAAGAFDNLGGVETYQRAVDQARQKMAGGTETVRVLGDTITGTLDSVLSGSQTWGQAFSSLMINTLNEIIQSISSGKSTGLGGIVLGALTGGVFGGGVKVSGSDALSNSLLAVPGFSPVSYEGGGYTGSGSRTGGLDGKGGYLAMVHPNETITDHAKGQAANTNSTMTMHTTIDLRGTTGDAMLDAKIKAGAQAAVQQGLTAYDKQMPLRVQQINRDPRRR